MVEGIRLTEMISGVGDERHQAQAREHSGKAWYRPHRQIVCSRFSAYTALLSYPARVSRAEGSVPHISAARMAQNNKAVSISRTIGRKLVGSVTGDTVNVY